MSSEDSDVEAEDELLSEGLRKMLFIVEEFGGLTKMMLPPKMMLMLVKYDEVKPWWRKTLPRTRGISWGTRKIAKEPHPRSIDAARNRPNFGLTMPI